MTDIGRARALFRALLGEAPYTDDPYYVGFRAEGQEIGLDPEMFRIRARRIVGWGIDSDMMLLRARSVP